MIEQKIKDITNKIVKEFNPEKVVLFGSYAWGTPTKDSDLDFLLSKTIQSKIQESWPLSYKEYFFQEIFQWT